MYVCIEVALHGDAHGNGRSNWAKGRDPLGSWIQYPNPAVPLIPRHSLWIILAHLCAFSDPTLLQAAKGGLFSHVPCKVTHSARHRSVAASPYITSGMLRLYLLRKWFEFPAFPAFGCDASHYLQLKLNSQAGFLS